MKSSPKLFIIILINSPKKLNSIDFKPCWNKIEFIKKINFLLWYDLFKVSFKYCCTIESFSILINNWKYKISSINDVEFIQFLIFSSKKFITSIFFSSFGIICFKIKIALLKFSLYCLHLLFNLINFSFSWFELIKLLYSYVIKNIFKLLNI